MLRPSNVFSSVEALQAAQAEDRTSLGLIKPKSITRIFMEYKPKNEKKEWEEHRARALAQKELFVDAESETRDLAFCPVRYPFAPRAPPEGAHAAWSSWRSAAWLGLQV